MHAPIYGTKRKLFTPRPNVSKGRTYPGILTSLSTKLLLNFTSPGLKTEVHGIKSSQSISLGTACAAVVINNKRNIKEK